ncbi:MAG TPA: diacylglycerol kinase family protein [Terriglobales bacterium]|nr:diacylglycerol kinase family protein [Terriglobales bacterium]
MHIAAILGPGNLAKPLAAFQREANADWTSLIEQADVIVIFGGDGTIHHQLKTLVELDVPVLIVPCGGGNDFARALGLRSFRDSISAWNKFNVGSKNVRSIDLGVIHQATKLGPVRVDSPGAYNSLNNGCHYFCCVAGVGLDAEITRRANTLPRWIRARGGYGMTAPREFIRFVPVPMRISENGFAPASFRPTTLAAVANAPSYGGGIKIAPRASMDDGKLDLCVVQAMSRFELFRLFPTVYSGRHVTLDKVDYVQTCSARIETESPSDVYADGEYVCQTPVEFTVAPKALQVIVPE